MEALHAWEVSCCSALVAKSACAVVVEDWMPSLLCALPLEPQEAMSSILNAMPRATAKVSPWIEDVIRKLSCDCDWLQSLSQGRQALHLRLVLRFSTHSEE